MDESCYTWMSQGTRIMGGGESMRRGAYDGRGGGAMRSGDRTMLASEVCRERYVNWSCHNRVRYFTRG